MEKTGSAASARRLRDRRRRGEPRVTLLPPGGSALVRRHALAAALAILLPAWIPMGIDASGLLRDGALAQESDAPDGQVEALARALGMTPAEIEALQLTSEEMQVLVDICRPRCST